MSITIVDQELTRLTAPRPCSICVPTYDSQGNDEAIVFCGKSATWAIDGFPVCREDIAGIAGMNSDNESFLLPALQEEAA